MAMTDLQTEFVGRRWRLFRLALKTSVLTVLTLGFYRFWMKTRLRRWYWSAIRPGGQPLEYVGEPIEKLLGFLIAVVIMAFYIGVVNLILVFASFALSQSNLAAYVMSFVGIIPIFFFAQYRARRYVLARTRWRGLRFGLGDGAWGYSWRALMHWAITILTLGLLYPRQVFWLEKYRTDRTHFGSVTLHQGGSWKMLYPGMTHMIIAGVLSAIIVGLSVVELVEEEFLAALVLTVPWMLIGLLHFRVRSLRLLTSHKSAGGVRLTARPRTGRVLRIYTLGFLATYFILVALVGAAAFLFTFVFGDWFVAVFTGTSAAPQWLMTTLLVLAYFSIFVLWGVFQHVLVTMPLYRHYAETLEINGAHELALITQRDRDEFTEAEGFAEALDLGAAI